MKYLVKPGWITSKRDNEKHFISASQLISLYGVNPKDCVIALSDYVPRDLRGEFTILEPRYHGDYSLENCKSIYIGELR